MRDIGHARRQFLRGLVAVGAGAALLRYSGRVGVGAREAAGGGASGGVSGEDGGVGDRRFDFDLLREVVRREAGKNVILSPHSVRTAMAMIWNGAVGETRTAMARVLGVEGQSLDAVNRACAELTRRLAEAEPGVQLTVANSLWARRGVAFRDDFLARTREWFGARVTDLDFDDSSAAETINAWVRDSTRGRIPTIVDRIDPLTVLFLINAVYFKGAWQAKFDPARTREEPFHLDGGREKRVAMMSRTGDYAYLKGEGFQAVRLPYGAGRVSMEVYLPDRASSLDRFLQVLDAQRWASWTPRFAARPCRLHLPRFRLEYDTRLNEPLKALGMGCAFDLQAADFSGMAPEKLYLHEVKHKSFVEVNEEGTEAAAATSVEVRVVSAPMEPEPVAFVVDRPFLFAIRDHPTGVLLFLAAIRDP